MKNYPKLWDLAKCKIIVSICIKCVITITIIFLVMLFCFCVYKE